MPSAVPHTESDETGGTRSFLRALGPAIIVACVVLGPGSILTASKVGCQHGLTLIWVPLTAGLLMFGCVALAARLGVTCRHTPCSELAAGLGRPAAATVGIAVFLIASCFQFSNNLGVLAAIEPLVKGGSGWQTPLLIAGNALIIATLFGMKRLYVPLEKLMMALVGIMLIAFAANLFFAQPSLAEIVRGLLPRLPDALTQDLVPRIIGSHAERTVSDAWLPLTGLVATTFSIAGAFYQAYLVREKGWNQTNLRQGLVDSLAGISVLTLITIMILVTAGTVLYGKVDPSALKSVGDVATQLEPLFGPMAKVLFCIGIFAGAFSSFLVNSIIGGTLLADGLGLDARIDSKWTKRFTVVVLLVGMLVAIQTTADARVPLIIFAQAVTVLGLPLLAASLLYLALKRQPGRGSATPKWILLLVLVGFLVAVVLAVHKAWSMVLKAML